VENGRLRLDLLDGTDTAPLVTLLVEAGVRIEEVLRGRASLEEVFLTLVQEEQE